MIPQTVRKARITGFLALPCFFAYSSPKGRSPAPEKAHKSVYRSRNHRSPVNPVSGSFITSIKYSVFPCPAHKSIRRRIPARKILPDTSAIRPLLCIPRCVPRLQAATARRDSHFPEIPLIRLSGITSPRRPERNAELAITYTKKNRPINRTVKLPVLLESSPYAGVRRISQIT